MQKGWRRHCHHRPSSCLAIAAQIFFCTRHKPRSSRTVCLLSRHLASCHYDLPYDLRSHTTRRNVFCASLFPSPQFYCVLTISLHPHLVSSLIFLSMCLFRSMAYTVLDTNFNSVSLVYEELCMDISQIISHININPQIVMLVQVVIELHSILTRFKSNCPL